MEEVGAETADQVVLDLVVVTSAEIETSGEVAAAVTVVVMAAVAAVMAEVVDMGVAMVAAVQLVLGTKY
jgi:hypothetical protein